MANGGGGSRLVVSGLTAEEAKTFHKYFMQGFLAFVGTTLVAHILVWAWRPWF